MNAVVYARKSTHQNVADDSKSTTRQIDNARAFAAERGWPVVAVYKDDGISGAETAKLAEKQRLLADIANGPPFQILIMQAPDRFSRRDGDEAFAELKAIARKGIEIWFYAKGERFTFGDFKSNVTGFLEGEFAAEFRRAIARKTHEAMIRRAQQGYVTGGRVFGYDNVRLNGHVERQINKAEASAVRDVYRRYADGEGFKQIAHALNAKQLPSPRPQRGRPHGWEPSTVRAVLKRGIYRGTVIYNKTRKRDDDGSRHRGRQPKRPESEWKIIDKAELRIVSQALADAVDERLNHRRHLYLRSTNGRLLGRPRGSVGNKHLLAGFIVCECGATFEAVRGYYTCSARRRKGQTVCPSVVAFPVAQIDNSFLNALEGAVLNPDFIDRVLDAAFAANPDAERETLIAERQRLAAEITNLTAAITAGGDIPALVKALSERDKKLKSIDAQLAKPVVIPDRDVLKAALELRTANWRDILRGPHIQQARMVLQHLIELPIKILNQPIPAYTKKNMDPDSPYLGKPHRGKWSAQTRRGGLLVGLIQNVASPTGFEPVFWP